MFDIQTFFHRVALYLNEPRIEMEIKIIGVQTG